MFRGGIGAPEILIILGVVVLLFGGKKLPELARGSGKALRIFKTEVSSLHDDDDDKPEALKASEADKKTEQG
jgi:sec-independent protein translocase protein TatA